VNEPSFAASYEVPCIPLAELNSGAACAGGKGIIDPVLAGGKKSGYMFAYTPTQGGDNLHHDGRAGHDWHNRSARFLFGPDGRDPLHTERYSANQRQQLAAASRLSRR
jgi:hypothetical protein